MKIYTTELISKVDDKFKNGEIVSRYDRIYFQNNIGVRKAGVLFAMSQKELEEYINCKLSFKYFANHYCNIRLEDGSVGLITLRDYQKDSLDFVHDNKFSIFFTSRQVGITVVHAIYILWYLLFNNDKGVMNVANKVMTSREFLRKMKDIYKLLPFYLKQGVTSWNERSISFENGSKIQTQGRSKDPVIGFNIDILYIQEFSRIPNNKELFNTFVPTVSAIRDSKIILQSGPNGYDFFYELVRDSERSKEDPRKNAFETKRIYYYQVPGRDANWVNKQIAMIGSEARFREEYQLEFVTDVRERTYTWTISNPCVGVIMGPKINKDFTIIEIDGYTINGSVTSNVYYGHTIPLKMPVLDRSLVMNRDSKSYIHKQINEGQWLMLDIEDVEGAPQQLTVTVKGYEIKK